VLPLKLIGKPETAVLWTAKKFFSRNQQICLLNMKHRALACTSALSRLNEQTNWMSQELHWLRRGYSFIFCVRKRGESMEGKRILKRQTIRKEQKEASIEVGRKDTEGWQNAQLLQAVSSAERRVSFTL